MKDLIDELRRTLGGQRDEEKLEELRERLKQKTISSRLPQ